MVGPLPGQRRAATALVGLGTVSALPAAVAGWNDWAALSRDQRRVGLVHAAANTVGLTSTRARWRPAQRPAGLGRALAYLGLSAASGGAYLGGHLAYKPGGTGQPEHLRPAPIGEGWHPLGDLSNLPQRELVTREIDDVSVILYRHGDDVTVMLERRPHQSGPLGEGRGAGGRRPRLRGCPWHGSTFRLNGGEVVHGPAANDQVLLPTRVVYGRVEARLP